MDWNIFDYLAACGLLFAAGIAYFIASRKLQTRKQRVVAVLIILAVLAIIWIELAVGIFD